jgi:EAL domain-containing protein (putative c-di-GMP-specific phosphodiesterase class I)/FixJ family two-component response regulator
MLNELGHWLRSADHLDVVPVPTETPGDAGARPPVCFIVDNEESNRHFMSLVLQGHGIETGLFPNGKALREGLARKSPDLIFLDVPIEAATAIEAIHAIGERKYRGALQLMSSRGAAVVDTVRQVAERYALALPPSLKKPIDRPSIVKVIQDQKFDLPTVTSQEASLEEALRGGWVEFWYQPKIDLRRKQLAGVESFARVRHPQHGMVSPAAFMQAADEKSLVALARESIVNALKTSLNFVKLGIKLRLAVNVSVAALMKLPIEAMVREFRSRTDQWPGLIFDVTEDQIAIDPSAVNNVMGAVSPYGIKLAIDDFGRGFLPLARLNDVAFAELKVDRTFVNDCATNKRHAAICKSVIDLAHNFGSIAVGVGVEKPADVVALSGMGCDLGQGFLFAQPMAEERFLTMLRQRSEKRPGTSA